MSEPHPLRTAIVRRLGLGLALAIGPIGAVSVIGGAVANAAPAGTVATGPDPTLIVTTLPSTSAPSTTGNVVQEFDTASRNQIGAPARVGTAPWASAITPDGTTAFVANQASGTVTPVTTSSVSTGTNLCLPVGDCAAPDTSTEPEGVAVTPDGRAVYVTNSGENSVSEIILGSGAPKVVNTAIGTTGGQSPFDVPDAIAITPDGTTAWVANYSAGTVSPIRLSDGTVGTPVSVGTGPTGLAVTPDGAHLIVADSGSGQVSDVTLADGSVHTLALEPTRTGAVPWAVAISPDGSAAWVTDEGNGLLVPVRLAGDVPGQAVSVGSFPVSVAITPDGRTAYVADEVADQVAVVDLSATTPAVVATISTDGAPSSVAVTPDQAPVASFSDTAGAAGRPSTFDATSSHTVPAGGSLSYSWDFGDGSSTVTTSQPTTSHTYATPGSYRVTLTVSDALGASTSFVYTGQTASLAGGPSATITGTVTVEAARGSIAPEAFVTGSGSSTVVPLALSGPPAAAVPGSATAVGSAPVAVALSPDGSTAWVADSGSDQLTPVSVATGTAAIPANWITVGAGPSALALSPNGTTAYVVDGGSPALSTVALTTGAVRNTTIPAASPSALDAIAVTPDGTQALITDALNNTVTPVALASGTVGAPVGASVLVHPDAIAVPPGGHTAYVVDGGTAAEPGGITALDLTGPTPQPQALVPLGGAGDHPDAISISADGSVAYVADAPTNGDPASIWAVPLSGDTVSPRSPITLGDVTAVRGLSVTPDGNSLYAAGSTGTGSVVVPVSVSGATLAAQPEVTLPAGTDPSAIAITPDQAPVAGISVLPAGSAPAGSPIRFDASSSSAASAPIAGYRFAFGDGSAAQTVAAPAATATYSYPVAGRYTASVTVTDRAGTATAVAYTGQQDVLSGSGAAVASVPVEIYPTVASVLDRRSSAASGIAGDSVTVTGTGFSTSPGATSVLFGTQPAGSVSCPSTTSCTAVVPPGKQGPVDVQVTVAGEASPISPPGDRFTYAVATTPVVTSVTPSSGPAAGGTLVTVRGARLTGATAVDFGSVRAGSLRVVSDSELTVTAPPGVAGPVDVTVASPGGTSAAVSGDRFTYTASPNRNGAYLMFASDGGIFSFGGAGFYGSMGEQALGQPVVGAASTPDHRGYWLVASDGGIFAFGDAHFYGSTGGITLNKPIVGIAATPDGHGYWLVASDGGIFAFGDATFYGSTGNITLNKPIVGIAATPDGHGYWLVASDGGIFAFGDAHFYGSTGGIALNKPVVGIAATPDGHGYWLVASDGGIFAFGDATFSGSTGNITLDKPIVGIAAAG